MDVMRDVRYAFRRLIQTPAATAVAVLSLAAAIGPNATLFSILDRLVLRASPVQGLDQLHRVMLRRDDAWTSMSYLDYLDYRRESAGGRGLIAYEKRGAVLSVEGRQEMVPINIVSENYFSILGVGATLGRALVEGDPQLAAEPPIVISHSLWRRRFAADRTIIGSSLLLNDRAFTVVGVAPRDFRGLEFHIPVDAWVPFSAATVLSPANRDAFARRDYKGISVMLRLGDGITKEQAESELGAVARSLAEAYPAANRGVRVTLASLEADRQGKAILGLIVLSLVSLVLLIACANVAGILLAQGEARRREIAVRLALGAGRGRLVRQLLVESLLLSLAASGLGLVLAFWLVDLVPALKPPLPFSLDFDVRLDARVLTYTLLVSLVTALGFGLAPALRASRPDLVGALKGDPPQPGRWRFVTTRTALLIGQIAVSQFLVTSAGLLLRTYLEVQEIHPGFDRHRNVVVVTLGVREALDYAHVVDAVRALPGVRRVSWSRALPLSGSGEGTQRVSIPGSTAEPLDAGRNAVGPDYLSVMGTRILQGRDFDARDRTGTVVVNETLARRLWADPAAAIGRHLHMEGEGEHEVIGVVEDGKYRSLLEPPMPFMFAAAPVRSGGDRILLVETAAEASRMAQAIRRTLSSAEPRLTITNVTTLRQHMRLALFLPETAAGLVATIAALAIFLASVGLYGVVAYSAARRTHEMGVRLALGASPLSVRALVLRQALALVAAGSVAGLIAAAAAARAVSGLLYRVSPFDPAALAGSALVVLAVTLVATHAPARRAGRVDPAVALRRE